MTSGIFKKFYINIRHYNTSVIISSQMFKSVSPIIRTNLNALILLGNTENEGELKKIYEEFSNGLSYTKWKGVYDFITNTPYRFLVINTMNKKGYRLIDSFKQYIQLS
jgi:hypothetical protein